MLYTIIFQWGTEPYTAQVRGRTVNEALRKWTKSPMGCVSDENDRKALLHATAGMGHLNRNGGNSYYRPITFRGQRSHLHVVGTSEVAQARRGRRAA